ncbi:carbohydrate ABC transporter permease [Vallicoccus soli]|uniref:Carbohydrate ABC transporter permease n=1 Tax=Vallicoccus soli TaxID=2339232 RepID=A0A3A3YSA7_9ACTN|nr:carbohydrate ABC transporter permease [Vallicoccus soli]RJK94231.1 carbohydrate ABC transporter permease [Vallicoccus soli]
MSTRPRARTAGRFLGLAAAAVFMLFPVYWLAVTAVTPREDLAGGRPPAFPNEVRLSNLSETWQSLPFSQWLVNSLSIAVVACVLSVTLNLAAGFVLAKYRFAGRGAIFLVIVSTLMIPIQVVMIPQFRIVAELGWLNSYWAVIIPRAAEAFGIFLARQFMLGIPDELLEAARVDGAGNLRTFVSVVLPLCKPLVAVLVVFTFMFRWNEFAWPLIVLREQALYTLPVGLSFLQGQNGTDYAGLTGMALLTSVPVLVVFLVFQRYLVEGVARTGLK